MDYDLTDIAATYDRGRDHGREVLRLWMDTLDYYVDRTRVRVILDAGCGTGRFSEALADHFNAIVLGLDPSAKMLARAMMKRRDGRVSYARGYTEAMPLPNASVDVVFMSMVFHHLTDPMAAARECRRVLRDAGMLFLRAGTIERVPLYPQVTFFPTSRPLMEQRFQPTTTIIDTFERAGFQTAAVIVVHQQVAPNRAAFAEKLAAGADSVLAALSSQEFQQGLEALRASSGLYCLKQYWYSLAPYGADIDDR